MKYLKNKIEYQYSILDANFFFVHMFLLYLLILAHNNDGQPVKK